MHAQQILMPLGLSGLSSTVDCTNSSIASILPANASLNFAVPLLPNSTFGGGPSNLAFPLDITGLPGLCAVSVNVKSSNVSSYNFGLFLPDEWNSRFIASGNGGFGGGISWPDMGINTHYGFASLSTDTGHLAVAFDGTWALNNPESVADWAYRALHGSVELGKTITEAYYASKIKYSYYTGCSTGGRQGLKEIQEFPEDFDGVLAGAPAWWTTHLQTWSVQVGLYNLPETSSRHIPASMFPVISAEVFKQCDPQDGLVDGIISSPQTCQFLPEALLCGPESDTSTCLTPPQVDTLYHLYSDWVDVNQTFVFPRLELGTEAQYGALFDVSGAPSKIGTQWVENFLVNDTNWDWQTFDYRTVQLADQINPGTANADNYDMSTFYKRGGKLIHYHGLADGMITAGSSVYFRKKVMQALLPQGIELDSWYRFFLVPGMQHCRSSVHDAPWYLAGTSQSLTLDESGRTVGVPGFEDGKHDALLALIGWVENGTAPEELVATKWKNDNISEGLVRQRPICPWPKEAKYVGSGDTNDPVNWQCRGLY
jgi:feruloyl esterase